MKKIICVIPARYKSSRFPGKPLADIAGKSMILRVFENAKRSKLLSKVVVATDDDRIYNHCKKNGINVVYTSEGCPNGSVRVAEVVADNEDEYVFEMQGDQPLVSLETIDDFITRAWNKIKEEPKIDVVIPYAATNDEQIQSSDILKVVVTAKEKLVFQSRHPLETGFRTLGLYLWKQESLLRFADLPVSNIEKIEDSHPIRLYVNDFNVQGLLLDKTDWVEVDREEHIAQVEQLLKKK